MTVRLISDNPNPVDQEQADRAEQVAYLNQEITGWLARKLADGHSAVGLRCCLEAHAAQLETWAETCGHTERPWSQIKAALLVEDSEHQ